MPTETQTHPSYRQLRLLAWMREPTRNNPDLPVHEAIKWDEAVWSVTEIMERSGVYTQGQRRACRADLEALRLLGRVMWIGGWRLGRES
jgi:hypothetical protein